MFNKSLIQFSFGGRGCVPSLMLDLRPHYVEVMKIMKINNLLHTFTRSPAGTLHSVPRPWSRPPLTRASARDSRTLMGLSGSVSCGVTAPLSWVLVCTRLFFVPSTSLFPQSRVSSGSSKRAYAIPRSATPRPLPTRSSTRDTQSSGSVSEGWACVPCPSEVWAAQVTKCFSSTVPGGPCVLLTSQSCHWVSLGRWWDCSSPCLGLWWSQACLSASGWGGACTKPARSPLVFSQSFVLWAGQAAD